MCVRRILLVIMVEVINYFVKLACWFIVNFGQMKVDLGGISFRSQLMISQESSDKGTELIIIKNNFMNEREKKQPTILLTVVYYIVLYCVWLSTGGAVAPV